MSNNPYNYGTVVTDPKMFFGRETILNYLCARLKSMQSTSIVGLRRIGKSSLLYQLARILSGEPGQTYVPLYIALQDARYHTVTGFVKTVTVTLDERLGGSLAVSDVTDKSSFSNMIDGLSGSGVKPILCLDEFERLVRYSEEFDAFLEALRALGEHKKLAMITTSRTPLSDLIQASGVTSPFDNIFSRVELGLLEPSASRSLRCEPFEREGIMLSPEHEALVEELGGRHPFYLQMACCYLYEALCRPESAQTNVGDIVREHFDRDAESHFERLWNHLDTYEKASLKVVVGQAIRTDDTERVLERLGYLGVVEQVNKDWQVFSTAFAKCVQQHPVPREKIIPVPSQDEDRSLSTATQLLLFSGTAIVVVIIAALVGSLVPEPKFRQVLIISALILLFALVGAGKLTGHDFLEVLGRLLRLGGS